MNRNFAIIFALVIQFSVFALANAQVSPIPKFSGELTKNMSSRKFSTYKADQLKNNASEPFTTQLVSNRKLKKLNNKLQDFSVSSRDQILNAILNIQEKDNYKDTLLFTEGNTVYIYKKLCRTKIIYSDVIDDTKKNEYQNVLNKFNAEQKEYDSVQAKIENLNQLGVVSKENDSVFATLTDSRLKIIERLEGYKLTLDSIDDHITLDLEFKKLFAPVAFSFYKTRRNSSKIFNNFYYGRSDISVLQSLEINRSKNVTNFNTELANAFFRTFRISLAANINETDNDTSSAEEINSDYQKLITNGGQFAIRIQSPLVFYHNSSDDLIFVANILNRFGFDLIPDDPNTKNNNFSNFIGGDLSFFLRTEKNVFSFFAQLPIGYTFGNNKFYEGQNFRDFSTLQGIFGVTIHDQFRIKFSGTFLSTQNELQRVPWSIGFQFTPSLSSKEN